METKKDNFDEGRHVDANTLMLEVKIKYTTLNKCSTNMDPKDAKTLVLTTKLENLEKKVLSSGEGFNPGSSSRNGKPNQKGDDKGPPA
eukprot:6366591-Ditylum_brightwellii.AAC.1